jgi:hypothetical protein
VLLVVLGANAGNDNPLAVVFGVDVAPGCGAKSPGKVPPPPNERVGAAVETVAAAVDGCAAGAAPKLKAPT